MSNQPYFYCHPFDKLKFLVEFRKQFASDPHYTSSCLKDLEQIIEFIGRDTQINDLRWAAYLLATVLIETTSPKTEIHQVHGKILKSKAWVITMKPVTEFGRGAGRNYFLPVKVEKLSTGNVLVTEFDGDQFEIDSLSGKAVAKTPKATLGAVCNIKPNSSYVNNKGTENRYYGRGYTQLTWWSNYARASVALGMGLQLLLKPDLVLKPEIAYRLMSHGMRTGEGFANGHRFSDYFHGDITDYVNARRMVNGLNRAHEIAEIAKKFEKILIDSKVDLKCPEPA